MIGEFLFIGLISGLLGLFYRNNLKEENMIFFPIYTILSRWVDNAQFCEDWPKEAEEEGYNLKIWAILGWIAYPLGYCIYCSTTWISIFLYILYITSWAEAPSWHWIIIGLLTAIAVSHLIVVVACKYILHGHPDFDRNPQA